MFESYSAYTLLPLPKCEFLYPFLMIIDTGVLFMQLPLMLGAIAHVFVGDLGELIGPPKITLALIYLETGIGRAQEQKIAQSF
jgi:hypothetical protein